MADQLSAYKPLVVLAVVCVLILLAFSMQKQYRDCTERGGDPQYVHGSGFMCFAPGVLK